MQGQDKNKAVCKAYVFSDLSNLCERERAPGNGVGPFIG